MLSAIPMGRFGTTRRTSAVAVRFLASPEAGYITGQTLIIDGGQVLPEGSRKLTPELTRVDLTGPGGRPSRPAP